MPKPSNADIERYDEIVRKLAPNPEQMERYKALFEKDSRRKSELLCDGELNSGQSSSSSSGPISIITVSAGNAAYSISAGKIAVFPSSKAMMSPLSERSADNISMPEIMALLS
jgi:hypothetical protein